MFVEMPVSNGIDTDTEADWSPDGSKVALTRNGTSVWVVNHDGSGGYPVDSSSAFLAHTKWSPDGQRIAYTATPAGTGPSAIYSALAIASGAPTNLTPGQEARGPLDWSPDGGKLLFTSNRTGNLEVYSMLSNGSSQTNLTNRAGTDDVGRWSPDGTRVVFVSQSRIWTMDSNGANPVNLSGTSGGFFGDPRWAPDGQTIFFVEDPDNDAQLFVMNGNGTNQHSIDSSASIDLEPVPSPDGSHIAWSSMRDGNYEIYVSNADGTNPVRVTNNSKPDTRPRWRPCP